MTPINNFTISSEMRIYVQQTLHTCQDRGLRLLQPFVKEGP